MTNHSVEHAAPGEVCAIKRELWVRPTPEELARVFCDMSSPEQAEFLNRVAVVMHSWGAFSRDRQCADVAQEELSADARNVFAFMLTLEVPTP